MCEKKPVEDLGKLEFTITFISFFDGRGMRDDLDKAVRVPTDADPTYFIWCHRFAPGVLL